MNNQFRLACVPDEVEFSFKNDWPLLFGVSRYGLTQQVRA